MADKKQKVTIHTPEFTALAKQNQTDLEALANGQEPSQEASEALDALRQELSLETYRRKKGYAAYRRSGLG